MSTRRSRWSKPQRGVDLRDDTSHPRGLSRLSAIFFAFTAGCTVACTIASPREPSVPAKAAKAKAPSASRAALDRIQAQADQLIHHLRTAPARRFVEASAELPDDQLYDQPLAYARLFELWAEARPPSGDPWDSLRVLELGSGGVGHLWMLAKNGASVTAVAADPLLRARQGTIGAGSLQLIAGDYPRDPAIVERVGRPYDLIISRRAITEPDLGAIHRALRPAGWLLIYSTEAEHAPLTERQYRDAGFRVIAGARDDSEEAARINALLGATGAMFYTLLVRVVDFPPCPLDPRTRAEIFAAAKFHVGALRAFKPIILAESDRTGVDPAVIAAIISRESGAGLLLSPRGPGGLGDQGRGHGLMQIDIGYFGDWLANNDWKAPRTNIAKGISVLLDSIDEVRRVALQQGLNPSDDELVSWAVSAYNGGPNGAVAGVLSGATSDTYTTGGRYSADVLCRADYYRARGYQRPR